MNRVAWQLERQSGPCLSLNVRSSENFARKSPSSILQQRATTNLFRRTHLKQINADASLEFLFVRARQRRTWSSSNWCALRNVPGASLVCPVKPCKRRHGEHREEPRCR